MASTHSTIPFLFTVSCFLAILPSPLQHLDQSLCLSPSPAIITIKFIIQVQATLLLHGSHTYPWPSCLSSSSLCNLLLGTHSFPWLWLFYYNQRYPNLYLYPQIVPRALDTHFHLLDRYVGRWLAMCRLVHHPSSTNTPAQFFPFFYLS